jgi:hypothetical protein
MPPNRMNRDEFYAAMAPHDDARLRKVLWTPLLAYPEPVGSGSLEVVVASVRKRYSAQDALPGSGDGRTCTCGVTDRPSPPAGR